LAKIKDLNSALSLLTTDNIALIQCNIKLKQELKKIEMASTLNSIASVSIPNQANSTASVCIPNHANTSTSVCIPSQANTLACVNSPVIVNTLANANINNQLSVNKSVYGNGNIPTCTIQKETHPFEYSIQSQMKLRAENRWLSDSFDEQFEEEQETNTNPHNSEEMAEIATLWDDEEEEDTIVLFSGKMLY